MRIPLFWKRQNPYTYDPVCTMEVPAKNPTGGSWKYKGVTYNFCAPGCNIAFQKEPEDYISGNKKINM
jgi:YHS domain-containing protein